MYFPRIETLFFLGGDIGKYPGIWGCREYRGLYGIYPLLDPGGVLFREICREPCFMADGRSECHGHPLVACKAESCVRTYLIIQHHASIFLGICYYVPLLVLTGIDFTTHIGNIFVFGGLSKCMRSIPEARQAKCPLYDRAAGQVLHMQKPGNCQGT